MSLYRQPGAGRTGALVAGVLVALVAGLLAGFLIGRGTAGDPSLADQVADLREELQPLSLAFEQVPIEYELAVRNGKVVARTEYDATLATIDRARSGLAPVRDDLSAINPHATAGIDRAIARLEEAVEAKVSLGAVEGRAARARRVVESAVGTP